MLKINLQSHCLSINLLMLQVSNFNYTERLIWSYYHGGRAFKFSSFYLSEYPKSVGSRKILVKKTNARFSESARGVGFFCGEAVALIGRGNGAGGPHSRKLSRDTDPLLNRHKSCVSAGLSLR